MRFLIIYFKNLFNISHEIVWSLFNILCFGFCVVQWLGKLGLVLTTHLVVIDQINKWRQSLRWYVWFHLCFLNYKHLILFVIYLIIDSNALQVKKCGGSLIKYLCVRDCSVLWRSRGIGEFSLFIIFSVYTTCTCA